ncbi:DUF2312 domain-containing protein [Paracoccus methylarcula]|uniref:DUF2312 domain-containing protein n=2 Tax=Paracoccus methylarcula TaxID=72022 RepID=A0A422QWD6_9RHOB|nr:DUF2312 domain-containing protein [Paracoccus methylarcula]
MKGDPDWQGHNSHAYSVTTAELRQFIERVERLNQEKADIAEQAKEVFAEAKGRGYSIPTIKKVIAIRKKDRDQVAEEDAVLAMYREALGC